MNYRIEWTIDVSADSPLAAAREALAMQRDPASTATVFDVTPVYEHPAVTPPAVRIDLTAEGEKEDSRQSSVLRSQFSENTRVL